LQNILQKIFIALFLAFGFEDLPRFAWQRPANNTSQRTSRNVWQ